MAITQGHQVICCDRNRRGGLKNIWLMDAETFLTGNPVVANNIYTSFPGNAAYQFDFDRYTAGFTANASRENGSTVVDVELTFYIPKVTAAVNSVLDELASTCGLFACVETYADDCATPTAATYKFILGYDEIFKEDSYLDFRTGEEATGVALQDANGAQVTLGGNAAMFPLGYSGAMTDPVPGGGVYTDAWELA